MSRSDEKLIRSEELFAIKGKELKSLIHRSIGALTFLNSRKQLGVGSGVAISPNLVLTSAHNIYDKEYNCENMKFKFYLGADGEAEEYFEVESWRYPPEFKSCPIGNKIEFDYAILKLKKKIPYKRYLPLSTSCELCLLQNNLQTHLQIFGFPGQYKQNYSPLDKFGSRFVLNQYGLSRDDRIVVIEPERFMIGYAVSTLAGQSGTPVCADGRIIAIHTGGGKKNEQFNVGRLITLDLLSNLQKMSNQLKAEPFTILEIKKCPHLNGIIQHNYEAKIKELQGNLLLYKLKNKDQKDIIKKLNTKVEENSKLLQEIEKLQKQINSLEISLSIAQTTIKNLTKQTSYSEKGTYEQKNYEHFFQNFKVQEQYIQADVKNNQQFNKNVEVPLNFEACDKSDVNFDPSQKNLMKVPQVIRNILSKTKDDTHLNLRNEGLEVIDLSKHIYLQEIFLNDNKLTKINLSSNVNLERLWLRGNQIGQIDLSKNIRLVAIGLSSNNIESIDVSKNKHITELGLSRNLLKTIDLKENIKLTHLYLSYNKIATIDLSQNKQLKELYLTSNQLVGIDLTNNRSIIRLELQQNKLSTAVIWSQITLNNLQLDHQRSIKFQITLCYSNVEYSNYSSCQCRCDQIVKKYANQKYNNQKCKYTCITRRVVK